MAAQAGRSPHPEQRSISETSSESVTSGDEEDDKNPASASNVSSSDITDISGYSLNVDVTGEESPLMVRKRVHRVPAKQTTSASCRHDSAEKDNNIHVITHQHRETLIRRPLHGRGSARTKDSYIEYKSTQCTFLSEPQKNISWNTHLVVTLLLIVAVCLVSLTIGFLQSSDLKLLGAARSKSDITPEMFRDTFNEVRKSFPVQTSGFWGIIRAAIKPIVLQEEPDQPAVFVLVVPSDAHATSKCFTRLFSDTITSLFQTRSVVEFFTDAFSGLSPERVKRLLDDQLKGGLSSGGRIVIVHHLEKLHGESAMMLHAYCDNENAPFRRAIFILSLYVDETSEEVAETETFVEQRLKLLWGNTLGTNRFYPLITRIAHSIAFMRPETNDVLAQIRC